MEVKSLSLNEAINAFKASSDPNNYFGTRSDQLNRLLDKSEGLKRGHVIELCGTPGVGKTTIGLCMAIDALKRNHQVVWLTSLYKPLPLARMRLLDGYSDEVLKSMLHMSLASISQLIALLNKGLPKSTGLIVIDGLSGLIEYNYLLSDEQTSKRKKRIITTLLETIQQVARKCNIGILLLSTMIVKRQHQVRRLVPELGYGTWERYLNRRLILYRDDYSTQQYWDQYSDLEKGVPHAMIAGDSSTSIRYCIKQQGIYDYNNKRSVGDSELDPKRQKIVESIEATNDSIASSIEIPDSQPIYGEILYP